MKQWIERLAETVKKMSTGQIILMAATISIISLGLWFLLNLTVWGFFQLIGVRFSLWDMVEALSAAAAVAQVFGGGVVLLAQLGESTDNRNLGIYNDIFARLMSEVDIEARRWIYQNLPDDPQAGLASLPPEGREHVKRVLNSFDHLGFLIQQDWITSDAVIKWVSPFVVKAWKKLGPYIEYELSHRPGEPDYYESARELARRCQQYRQQNMPPGEDVWRPDAL